MFSRKPINQQDICNEVHRHHDHSSNKPNSIQQYSIHTHHVYFDVKQVDIVITKYRGIV